MTEVLGAVELNRRVLVPNTMIRVLMGGTLVWLYAAARFRLRSTLRTAARVGVVVWFLSYVPLVWTFAVFEVLPRSVLLAMTVWGLVETMLAAIAGGFVHQATRPDDARY